MADQFNKDEENNLTEDASADICRLFNIFPQGFLSGESLKAIPISKKITEVDELADGFILTDEERERRRLAIIEKNKNRFSKKNINNNNLWSSRFYRNNHLDFQKGYKKFI